MLQGLQRQISLDEKQSKERLAEMAERTNQSFSEQEQRIRDIAQQGASRIQHSREEGVGKMAAVHAGAVQAGIPHLPSQHCSGTSHRARQKGRQVILWAPSPA